MALSRSVQKEIEALKKEISALRNDQAKLRKRAGAVAEHGVEGLSALKDDLVDRVSHFKDTISGSAGDVASEIADQLDDLKATLDGYTEKAEKTVTAHPLAVVAGAVVIGVLIGRLSR